MQLDRRALTWLVPIVPVGAVAAALIILGGAPETVASPPPPVAAPGKYLGASTCDGANCHTKAEAREKPPYLTEYTSWSALKEDGTPYDRHSYAWKRLRGADKGGDDRSPAIMAKLNAMEGTKDLAEASQRCLSCHGTSVHDYGVGKQNPGAAVGLSKELQGARYRPEEGVSCDGCHGPAEKWLKTHDKQDWTIAEWKKLGGASGGSQALYDKHGIYYSKDLVLWADQCVRCHLKIDTNLIDAGHPDLLSFELFTHNSQVPHWREYSTAGNDPALPAAGPTHAASEWLVGQAAALREALGQVESRAKGEGKDKATAEHLATAWKRASAHWGVLRHALKTLQPKAHEELQAAMAGLAPVAAAPDKAKETAGLAGKARAAAAGLLRPLADAPVDGKAVLALLRAVAEDKDALADQLAADQLRLAAYALCYAHLQATNPDALMADPPADKVLVAVYALYESPDLASPGFKAAHKALLEALPR